MQTRSNQLLGLATVSPFPISWFYHKDIFPSLCYNSGIKRKEMVMCPKCNGKLVAMAYPDEDEGLMCLACGRYYYHKEPEAWEPEGHQGMRAFTLGRDVYASNEKTPD